MAIVQHITTETVLNIARRFRNADYLSESVTPYIAARPICERLLSEPQKVTTLPATFTQPLPAALITIKGEQQYMAGKERSGKRKSKKLNKIKYRVKYTCKSNGTSKKIELAT